jgi:hypothetical protein
MDKRISDKRVKEGLTEKPGQTGRTGGRAHPLKVTSTGEPHRCRVKSDLNEPSQKLIIHR